MNFPFFTVDYGVLLVNIPILLLNSYPSAVEYSFFTVDYRGLLVNSGILLLLVGSGYRSGKETEPLTLGCQILTTNLLLCRE